MDSAGRQQEDGLMMEAPEIGKDLLDELLDTYLAGADGAEEAQLGLPTDLGDGVGWVDSQELLNYSIHPHHDCEDCGLDGILSDFEVYGSSPRSPGPYVVFVDDETMEWAETADAAMGPFTGECMGDWYMDGMVMAMDWEEEDGGSGFSFEPCYGGGEAGADQVYGGSPLWE
ncbi:hypothetical protein BAE44_0007258 [Dichanthelium oligosanthes]|uniref:Uncharacterized protein n=1 Tax=Dichanthelium oligosanthes TaxID=888268 RepID=A0A1E5W2W9_9POAL|nr:hypothetical protein BAE44_0007258 [Dichanthelium oligosanthes]